MLKVYLPVLLNVTLLPNKDADDQAEMTSLGWALIQHDGVLLRRGPLDTDSDTDTHRCEDMERMSSASPRTPEASRSYEGHGSLPSALARSQPCGHLDLRLLASRTVTQYISVLSAPPVCWGQPQETNTAVLKIM